jgi:hypothetical protein
LNPKVGPFGEIKVWLPLISTEPLPFGEMHTENISSTELIRAAIVEVCLSRPERYT